jgi:hypothetical protein
MSTRLAEPAIIETDLGLPPSPLAKELDPVAAALRSLGFSSISTGLRTAQVNGILYDLDSAAQAAITRWLDGEWPPTVTVRLLRHQFARAS